MTRALDQEFPAPLGIAVAAAPQVVLGSADLADEMTPTVE